MKEPRYSFVHNFANQYSTPDLSLFLQNVGFLEAVSVSSPNKIEMVRK
jgi:hypothetical protein